MDNHQITVKVVERQVVRMNIGQSQVSMQSPSRMKMSIVTMGRQGPVGTVAEDVLARAMAAEAAANEAKAQSSQVADDQTTMVDGMTMAINHYIGVIGVQE
ncbi:hypothetical protein [Vibrio parahaemolyticus]|uniref:hypothetical protein n=1 Tax=Vibrio parahaemolyticus TaxID=670 RepID=UPI00111F26AE|nr:hypothetical protein [Vibrio parahaemolyticus]TOP74092.1 hypothetical protein CGH10_22185 [Vibrio parahaemolyticus]TPA69932.1 hypothetical protein DXJ77_23450 [Vibrio parahaemolyticus]